MNGAVMATNTCLQPREPLLVEWIAGSTQIVSAQLTCGRGHTGSHNAVDSMNDVSVSWYKFLCIRVHSSTSLTHCRGKQACVAFYI